MLETLLKNEVVRAKPTPREEEREVYDRISN
jgi:hypothetical protein